VTRWSSRFRSIHRWVPSVAGAVLLVSIVAGCSCSPPGTGVVPTFAPPPTQLPSGSTYTVGYGSVATSIEARGRVEAKREVDLMFTLEGVLKGVYVSPGDTVEEGTLLAELDAPELQRAVEQAQYGLQEAEDTLEIAKLQLSLIGDTPDTTPDVLAAEIDLKKAEAALAHAQEEYDKAVHRTWEPPEVAEAYAWEVQLKEWDRQLAEARLNQAQYDLRQAQYALSVQRQIQELRVEQAGRAAERARAQLTLATEELTDTLVTAPFSGMIVSIDKGVGDRVGPYEALGAIADPSELWVVAVVPEEDAKLIGVGQRAAIRLDIYPDREYAGSVLQIASQPIAWQGGAAYEVTVAFDLGQAVPPTLQAGASVAITGQSREGVLVVPNHAILSIGGKTYVEAIGEDGGIERVEVETGLSGPSETEIVAGLVAGQEIRIP
jgi:HlyD family secretion protein